MKYSNYFVLSNEANILYICNVTMILQRFALYLTVNLLYIWVWPFMTVITIRISLKKMFAKKIAFL